MRVFTFGLLHTQRTQEKFDDLMPHRVLYVKDKILMFFNGLFSSY